jgi:hypothetical protein
MNESAIKSGQIISGPLFNEPMRVETVQANGPSTWVVGLVGIQSERFRKVTLTSRDLETLKILELLRMREKCGPLNMDTFWNSLFPNLF